MLGLCSFVANFSQAFKRPLVRRYKPWKSMCSIEKLVGKLISAIQKEWNEELGEPQAEASEKVMYKAHDLLQAVKKEHLPKLLSDQTITEYLGEHWVKEHPSVLSAIEKLENHV